MPATSPTKAVLAAILAGLTSLVTALQDKTSLDSLNALGWLLVVLSAAVTGLTVYLVPNTPTTRRRGDVGENYIGLAIGVLLIVVLVVVLARLL